VTGEGLDALRAALDEAADIIAEQKARVPRELEQWELETERETLSDEQALRELEAML